MTESALFQQLSTLATEQRNPASESIDAAPIAEILDIMSREDQKVAEAVRSELPYIEEAVRHIVRAFRNGGRLIYVGAGTSGRLGILDATECPPTFGTDPKMVQGLIAGGKEAVFRSQEGAEDREEDGARDLEAINLQASDVVCGIAASRRTPYVVGAVAHARSRGCATLYVTCTGREQFALDVDVAICAPVGPEVIMGSTRMKSGTAQKMILNMLTTASMIRIGKVYENMMVDLQMTSQKLVERSRRTVMMVTGVTYAEATSTLAKTSGHVKPALVMLLSGVDAPTAYARLERAEGFVRPAIAGDAYTPND